MLIYDVVASELYSNLKVKQRICCLSTHNIYNVYQGNRFSYGHISFKIHETESTELGFNTCVSSYITFPAHEEHAYLKNSLSTE